MVSDFSDGLLLKIPSTCAGAGAQFVLGGQVLSRLPFRTLVLNHSWLLSVSSPRVTVGGFWEAGALWRCSRMIYQQCCAGFSLYFGN